MHDGLVRAPVPDAEDHGAEDGACPGVDGVAGRLDHVEVVGRERGAEAGEASDVIEARCAQDDRAGDEHEGLEEVGVDDGLEAAGDGVDTGGYNQEDRGGEVIPAEHAAHQDGAREQVHGDFGEDVGDDLW